MYQKRTSGHPAYTSFENSNEAQETPPRAASSRVTSSTRSLDYLLPVEDFFALADEWLFDCRRRNHSLRTIEFRRHVIEKLKWFLKRENTAVCGRTQLRRFLEHVTNGHTEEGGRWGNPELRRETAPATQHRYFRELRTFSLWMVEEEETPVSLMAKIKPPSNPAKPMNPFTLEEVEMLLDEAKKSPLGLRDYAIIMLLFDTGLRATEMCELTYGKLNLRECQCTVMGKGKKEAIVPFSRKVARAISKYLRENPRSDDMCVFLGINGLPMTRNSLQLLIRRLCKKAGIKGKKQGPHTLRHSFATELTAASADGSPGAPAFVTKEKLRHSSLTMSMRYVHFVNANPHEMHRQFSPAKKLKDR